MRLTAHLGRVSLIVNCLSGLALSLAVSLLITHNSPLITHPAYAQGEFDTNYNVTYEIGQNGQTHVTQNIELVNKTANYYAEKFELKIGSVKVKDVTAQDNTGPLQVETKFENEITTVTVKFNQKVIGAGKNLTWTLSYNSEELTTKSGQIWEVSIPKVASSAQINNYDAKVLVPRNFGPIAFTTPSPKETKQVGTNQEFVFDKDQLTNSGIAMSFGDKQVFSFKLVYYLSNDNITSQIEEVALPPDNNYQQMVFRKIDPAPLDVVVDGDGNFLAKYKLASKQKIAVTVDGDAEVFSKPFRNIYDPLSPQDKETYTQPQRYWETDNASIKDKANELKSPEAIYDFVSSYLKYNDKRLNNLKLERRGAAAAFLDPSDSVCTEFTDLFIALARAAKIPAREVEGYAYTQNERLKPLSLTLSQGDILHAWPEYWDDKLGWVQVDPTWGSTSGGLNYFEKLDFNHITFVQKGLSSTSPAPAGAYKDNQDTSKKSVFVEFANNLPTVTQTAHLTVNAPSKIVAGIPTSIKATVKNEGSATIFKQKASIATSQLNIQQPSQYDVTILPPFASRTFIYKVNSKNLFAKTNDNLIFSFSNVQTTKPIMVEPFYKIIYSKFLLIALILGIFIITFGIQIYKKFSKKKN